MSRKKKTLEDVQVEFSKLKAVMKELGQSLDSEVGIAYDAEKGRVSLTKGQLILKSMSASAFVGHVSFLEVLSRECEQAAEPAVDSYQGLIGIPDDFESGMGEIEAAN